MRDGFGILSEGETAAESGWIDRFGGDPAIFAALLAEGILRNSGLALGRRQFTLNFVGLLSIGNSVWFAFPKASKAREWNDADVILRTIIEYRHKVSRAPSSVNFSATADRLYTGTLVDTFTALVLWTLDRGFHHHATNDSKLNYEGVDWARTINSTPAMHSNASVVYPAPISRIQSSELSVLAEIQAFALLDMRHRLSAFAAIIVPDAEDLWEQCADVLEHGQAILDQAFIEGLIDDFAGSTNRDEDLDLIALLRDWFVDSWSAGPRLSAYGISAFHTVWEDMCAQAMSSLGEPIAHAEVASQPSYSFHGQEMALSPQRPDILLERTGSAILADAKWYLFDAQALPQTPDAIKQFAYELSIDSGMPVDANMLLLPSENTELWSIAGALQMTRNGDRDDRFRPVLIIALNWLHLARLYVNRECLTEMFMTDVIAQRETCSKLKSNH